MPTPVTIAGIDVYPSEVHPVPFWIGGELRRAMDGTAYRKNVGQKVRLSLAWDSLTAQEYHDLRVVWEQARQGAVAIACAYPLVAGSFLITDPELAFRELPSDGRAILYSGKMTFEER